MRTRKSEQNAKKKRINVDYDFKKEMYEKATEIEKERAITKEANLKWKRHEKMKKLYYAIINSTSFIQREYFIGNSNSFIC